MSSIQESSLHQLIDICCDNTNAQWESAWREFLKRYKQFIYLTITRRCNSWHVSRLRRQLSDTVNDIVSEVFTLLSQSLSQFRELDDEAKFKFWLATICNRATGRFIKREFFGELAEPDIEEFQNYIGALQFDSRWELYESVVNQLRTTAALKKQNLERDINIFQLYTWSDLSQPMILSHPCYAKIGHRVIDNVVNRLRGQIRQEKSTQNSERN